MAGVLSGLEGELVQTQANVDACALRESELGMEPNAVMRIA
jgi:hypothetical protein